MAPTWDSSRKLILVRRQASGRSNITVSVGCVQWVPAILCRMHHLLAISLIIACAPAVAADLPNNLSHNLRRIASAASWSWWRSFPRYQWLPDSRLLVFELRGDRSMARILDPMTGQHVPLIVYNKIDLAAYPVGPLAMAGGGCEVSPDGKFTLMFIGRFLGPDQFVRTLSLDGYRMQISPLDREFSWPGYCVWEWTGSYHGWATFGTYLYGFRGRHAAVAHFDSTHPEQPRIVEIPDELMPLWASRSSAHAQLIGFTDTGEGVLAPRSTYLETDSVAARQHTMPVSIIDAANGKLATKTYMTQIPPGASVEDFVLAPDARSLAWRLRFEKAHRVGGIAKLYTTDEIWISDLEGTNMRQLAYQAIRIDGHSDINYLGFGDLTWKDNQTVSFILNGVLYTYPVK